MWHAGESIKFWSLWFWTWWVRWFLSTYNVGTPLFSHTDIVGTPIIHHIVGAQICLHTHIAEPPICLHRFSLDTPVWLQTLKCHNLIPTSTFQEYQSVHMFTLWGHQPFPHIHTVGTHFSITPSHYGDADMLTHLLCVDTSLFTHLHCGDTMLVDTLSWWGHKS